MKRSIFPQGAGLALFSLWISVFLGGTVQAAAPTLTHLFPAGGQRGTKVAVTCTGSFSWPVKVWAPGVEVVVAKESGKLEVTIPADLAADRVWFRLYNEEGASALVPFLLGTLKEIPEKEPNDKPKTAQEIPDPQVTINGVLNSGDVDGFDVTLKAGQTLVASVDANGRLGSPMDGVLQLVSPQGTVLAENHDDVGLDPRLVFTAKKAGTYIVRLFAFSSTPNTEIRLSGGSNFVYRLTLTTGGFVSHAESLNVPLAEPGTIKAQGWNLPDGLSLAVKPFGGQSKSAEYLEQEVRDDLRKAPQARLGIAFDPRFAGSARVRLTPFGVVEEQRQNIADSKTRILTPSVAVTGCLRSPRQTDAHPLALKKGQQVVITLESRSIDFPVDPVLKLLNSEGAKVAQVDDVGSQRDAVLTHTAAKDGIFQLMVSDRFAHGGNRYLYRLTARLDQPDFELSLSGDTVTVNPDKPTDLAIKVQRRAAPQGAIGPITVEVVGLPKGVTATPVVSEPTGATATAVTLKLTTTGGPFSGPIRIVGKTTKPTPMERFAQTPAKLGAAFDWIWLTATEKKKAK